MSSSNWNRDMLEGRWRTALYVFNDKLNSWINLRNSGENTNTFLDITVVMILISIKSVWDSPQTQVWAESKTFLLTILKEPGCEKIICIFPHHCSWKDLFYVWYGIFQALPFWAVVNPIVLTSPDRSAEIILVRNNKACIAMDCSSGPYWLKNCNVWW